METALYQIKTALLNGDLSLLTDEAICMINSEAKRILNLSINSGPISPNDATTTRLILEISDLLYNNSSASKLPLDDGIYDMLIAMYRKIDPSYRVGSAPVQMKEITEDLSPTSVPVNPFIFLSEEAYKDPLYIDNFKTIAKENAYPRVPAINPLIFGDDVLKKKYRDTGHNYPNLVGTLDKCKFVLNSDAKEKGVFNDANVTIFERDFIQPMLQRGIIQPNEQFYMVAELKYDGISIEADVNTEILSARTRGDTAADKATDLSQVLGGYQFPRAIQAGLKDDPFGMKFEAIISYDSLQYLNTLRNVPYKNARNAIMGILSSIDAQIWKNFVTLVPLRTSMGIINSNGSQNQVLMDRVQEIEFLNRYYCTGIPIYYAVLCGNYMQILFQLRKFMQEASYMRDIMPFMYDGVVVSFLDPAKILGLGRTNFIDNYSIAVKFPAQHKETIFRGYTYTVGQNGVVTPMLHFDPVEFNGTIHDVASGHSFDRFKQLNLKYGDIIALDYVNDVMPYASRVNCAANDMNKHPVIPFPSVCECGAPIAISPTGKTASCTNLYCTERQVGRISNMLQKLKFKDFSESTVKSLKITGLEDFLTMDPKRTEVLGPKTSQKFLEQLNEFRNTPIPDFKIIGALGFTNIAEQKWKLILNCITLTELIDLDDLHLSLRLNAIKGIGESAINTILYERNLLMSEIRAALRYMKITVGAGTCNGPSIRFTGFRDKELMEMLNNMGCDCTEGSITKSTNILLIPYVGFQSTKISKASASTIIVPVQDFKANMDYYLKYSANKVKGVGIGIF